MSDHETCLATYMTLKRQFDFLYEALRIIATGADSIAVDNGWNTVRPADYARRTLQQVGPRV